MRYGEHVGNEGLAMDSSNDLTTVVLLFLFLIFALLSLSSFELYRRCRVEFTRRARRRNSLSRSVLIRLGVRFCVFFAATITFGVACFISSFHYSKIETVVEQNDQHAQTVTARNSDASFVFSADRSRKTRLEQVSDVSTSGEPADSASNSRIVHVVSMPVIPACVLDFEKESGEF